MYGLLSEPKGRSEEYILFEWAHLFGPARRYGVIANLTQISNCPIRNRLYGIFRNGNQPHAGAATHTHVRYINNPLSLCIAALSVDIN